MVLWVTKPWITIGKAILTPDTLTQLHNKGSTSSGYPTTVLHEISFTGTIKFLQSYHIVEFYSPPSQKFSSIKKPSPSFTVHQHYINQQQRIPYPNIILASTNQDCRETIPQLADIIIKYDFERAL